MSFKLLHLSDIHVNFKNYETARMRDKLFEFLKSKAQEIDYIVISGDHVYKNGDYSDTRKFYSSLQQAVPGIPLVFVPGNHDVDRNDAARNICIQGIRHHHTPIEAISDSSITKLLLTPFKSYFEAISAYTNTSPDHTVEFYRTDDCTFILINTALTSNSNDEQGQLYIDLKLLEEKLKNCDNHKPIIAVGHHTLDSLDANVSQKVQNLLRDNNVRLYLCGHTHKMEIADYLQDDNQIKQLVSGSGMVDNENINGFYIVEYSDNEVIITAFYFDLSNENWDIAHQLSEFTNGAYTFNLSSVITTTGTPLQDLAKLFSQLDSVTNDTKAFLVLINKYPSFGSFRFVDKAIVDELTDKSLIQVTKDEYSFSISQIGGQIVNSIPQEAQNKMTIRKLKEFHSQYKNDFALPSMLCCEYIEQSKFTDAKQLLRDYGRYWLETIGLKDFSNMLDKIPCSGSDIDIIYFKGLTLLFQGSYQKAYAIFGDAVQQVSDKTIKFCFQAEMAECQRRRGDFHEAINLLNTVSEKNFDKTYWNGVIYELLGHFTRQFELTDESIEFYRKAIALFDSENCLANRIEKWHCLYALNMLDIPLEMQPDDKPGGFLKGLYYLTNAKYYAHNGNTSLAIRCVNESIASFKLFHSEVYRNRACILKLLIFLTEQHCDDDIDVVFQKLTREEIERVKHERILYNFVRTFDKSYIVECFQRGLLAKGKALLSIQKKFSRNDFESSGLSYRSQVVLYNDNKYRCEDRDYDYGNEIEDAKLCSTMINYI